MLLHYRLQFSRNTSSNWLFCAFKCKICYLNHQYSFTSSPLQLCILPFQACGRKCCQSFTHDRFLKVQCQSCREAQSLSSSGLDSGLFVSPPPPDAFYSCRVLRKLTNHTTKIKIEKEREREREKKGGRRTRRKIQPNWFKVRPKLKMNPKQGGREALWHLSFRHVGICFHINPLITNNI